MKGLGDDEGDKGEGNEGGGGKDVTIAGRPTEKVRWRFSANGPWKAEMSNYEKKKSFNNG